MNHEQAKGGMIGTLLSMNVVLNCKPWSLWKKVRNLYFKIYVQIEKGKKNIYQNNNMQIKRHLGQGIEEWQNLIDSFLYKIASTQLYFHFVYCVRYTDVCILSMQVFG